MITNFFIKTFIKDNKDIKNNAVRAKYGILEGWVSIILNFLLFIIKIVAGFLVNSISLKVDAFHSLSDMASSIAVIWGFKLSGSPPDKEHPFGHERMEYITTLIVAILLMVTGFEFLKAAIERIMNPEPVLFDPLIIILVIFTMLAKEWLARFSRDLAIIIDSKSLQGDFLHHRTDAITTLMVLIALFSEKINFPMLDGIIGILVSIFIIYTGFTMVNEMITPLLGESASYKELLKIKTIAMSEKRVKGVHDIMMHKYGKVRIISLHVELPEDVPLSEGHEIIEDLEEKINLQMYATTIIHLDPIQKQTDELRAVHKRMAEIIRTSNLIESYHDVRIVKVKGGMTVILDVVASKNGNIREIEKTRDQITSLLKDTFAKYTIKVWVEPHYHMTV